MAERETAPDLKEALKKAKSPEDLSKALEAEGFDMQELSLNDLDQVAGGTYSQEGFPPGGNFGGMLKAYKDKSGNMCFFFTAERYTDTLGTQLADEAEFREWYYILRAAFPEVECENNIHEKVWAVYP